MKKIAYLIPLAVFSCLLYIFWSGLAIDPHQIPSVLIDKPTPEFDLPQLDKPEKKLSKNIFQGQVSLLNVWASWCFTCAQEHSVLMEIAHQKIVKVYGLDYKDSSQKALSWLRQLGNPYTAVGFDATGNVAINWGVYGTPETYLIDQYGIIRYKHMGPMTLDVWKNTLLPLIMQLDKG